MQNMRNFGSCAVLHNFLEPDCTWGGALVFEVGYHSCKKIHVIRVIFQDQAMYARTSFRGATACKLEKRCVFGHIDTFGKDMRDKQIKRHAKTHI